MSQEFLHQLIEFSTRHWWMVVALLLVIVLIVIEEIRGKALSATQISSQQLTQGLNRDQATVIDVRDSALFRDGHIIKAVNILAADIESNPRALDKYKQKDIVLVDSNGVKASSLANRLRKQGFDKVNVLRGGLAAWKQDNMPLVKGK